jgi:hypothetical protein
MDLPGHRTINLRATIQSCTDDERNLLAHELAPRLRRAKAASHRQSGGSREVEQADDVCTGQVVDTLYYASTALMSLELAHEIEQVFILCNTVLVFKLSVHTVLRTADRRSISLRHQPHVSLKLTP